VVPERDAWDAWHPRVIADRLAGIGIPWYVAAGWALDLFRAEQTRAHADLEIAVPADRFPQIAARFTDCRFRVAHRGALLPATAEAMRISQQTWAWQPATGKWRFDVFREPHHGDLWIYRRDQRIRRPYTEIIEHSPDGIPFLVPEVVLLFKTKNPRAKDEADFHAVLPWLDRARRRWLDEALGLVDPAHPWRRLLSPPEPAPLDPAPPDPG
jgi:hypothetical protein